MQLYRGFIIDETSNPNLFRDKSDVDLKSIAEQDLNPHDIQFADKLLWATPDKEYACKVNLARLVTNALLDPDYEQKIKEGKVKLVIATYQVDESNVFEAEGKHLQPFRPDSDQYVIQQCPKPTINAVKVDSSRILQEMLWRTNSDDTMERALHYACARSGKQLKWVENIKNMRFIDGLKMMIETNFPGMLTEGHEKDIEDLAESLFGASAYLMNIAKNLRYPEEIKQNLTENKEINSK